MTVNPLLIYRRWKLRRAFRRLMRDLRRMAAGRHA
jgi:hypothetical protein